MKTLTHAPFRRWRLKLSFILSIVGVLLGCNTSQDIFTVVRQPAEFEDQAAVWVIWPPTDHKQGESNESVTALIISNLLPYQSIHVTTASEEDWRRAQEILADSILSHPNFNHAIVPSIELWVRDMGPNFVYTREKGLTVVDFNFNSWGYTEVNDPDNLVEEAYDRSIGTLLNLPIIRSELISEGGNREVNGKGTLMLTETVELGRNPTWTKARMENEFKRVLGVSNVIWLKQGVVEDDHTFLGPIPISDKEKAYTVVTTNGHIDEFARFANDSTILLAQVPESGFEDPVAQENHRRLEENAKILEQAVDQDGNLFTVVRMPTPITLLDTLRPGDSVYDYIKTLEYQDGSVFPEGKPVPVVAAISYLNFLITPKVVLGQKYWRQGLPNSIKERDEQAASVLRRVFPNRKIVMLDAYAVNLGGGGIHCITMNQPPAP